MPSAPLRSDARTTGTLPEILNLVVPPFCGNHDGAENMAVVCSLIATCKAQEVNPREYLNDIIEKMPTMKDVTHEELVQLLPHKWRLQHSKD